MISKSTRWFAVHRVDNIRDTYFNKCCFNHSSLAEYDDFIHILHDRMVVHFDTGRQQSLAIREFALSIEELERFIRKEPLRLIYESIFGVLALESEGVDPRL